MAIALPALPRGFHASFDPKQSAAGAQPLVKAEMWLSCAMLQQAGVPL